MARCSGWRWKCLKTMALRRTSQSRETKETGQELPANSQWPMEAKRALNKLVGMSVAESTAQRYEGALRLIDKWMQQHNLRLGPESFVQFIYDRCVVQGFSSARTYAAAVRKRLVQNGELYPWTDSLPIKEAVRGATRKAKLTQKVKGILTVGMLKDFCAWCDKAGLRDVRDAAILGFMSGFRISQLEDMRCEDLLESDGCFEIMVRKRKEADEVGMRPVSNEFVAAFNKRKKWVGGKGQMFPRKVAASLREALKKATKDLEWPPGLDFGGCHILRHSAARQVKAHIEKVVTEFMTMQSQGVYRSVYAKSQAERLMRVMKR